MENQLTTKRKPEPKWIWNILKISDEGLEHLGGLTRLEWLSLDNTTITKDAASRLSDKLPVCHLRFPYRKPE